MDNVRGATESAPVPRRAEQNVPKADNSFNKSISKIVKIIKTNPSIRLRCYLKI